MHRRVIAGLGDKKGISLGAQHHACVLQGAEDKYEVGTCNELLKWKFAHLNSVDFLLRISPAHGERSGCLANIVSVKHEAYLRTRA